MNTEIENKIEKHLSNLYKENGIISTEIEQKEVGDFTFAVSHTTVKTSKGMHVYGMYCFYGWELLYKVNNVIDKDVKRTIEEAQRSATTFFNHYSNLLNNL